MTRSALIERYLTPTTFGAVESGLDTSMTTNIESRLFLGMVPFHDASDGEDADHALGILNVALRARDAAEARSRLEDVLEDESEMFDLFFSERAGVDDESEQPCTDNGWFYSRQAQLIEVTEGQLAEAGIDVDLR